MLLKPYGKKIEGDYSKSSFKKFEDRMFHEHLACIIKQNTRAIKTFVIRYTFGFFANFFANSDFSR